MHHQKFNQLKKENSKKKDVKKLIHAHYFGENSLSPILSPSPSEIPDPPMNMILLINEYRLG